MAVTSAETMGWLRAGVGIALIAAPGVPLRLPGREQPTAASVLLMRTIGIRDLVLGLGTVAAARSDGGNDIRRWIDATTASDALDVAASLASFRSIGKRDAIGAALLALAFVGGDLTARRSARAGADAVDGARSVAGGPRSVVDGAARAAASGNSVPVDRDTAR